MDIHRCRFVPYPASTINALAFSHPSTPKESVNELPHLRLAIGRANGNIEIWNPQKGSWVQESILRGGKERSIEGLVWTHDLEEEDQDGMKVPGKVRLFSVGYSTVITEWDLALGKPVRHSGGNYGEIWCMAVQPRWQPPKKPAANGHDNKIYEQHIAVGCADGTLVLHSTADGDLQFLRTLARPPGKKSRVLSVVFLGRDRIVAGYADSTIRIYDIHTGRPISSMSLGAGKPGGPSEILVWSVKCLPNGNIVSGDSTGEVRFWDGKTFTLLQRIQSHKADILALAVSADGSAVFSGGMDRRTTMYRLNGDSGKGRSPRWAEISHQRYHSHDIKIMSTFESRDLSVVASGVEGVDATPIIIPLREFGREHIRSLPAFPSAAPLQSAPWRRLLMSWWDREIRIWRIEKIWAEPSESQDEADPPQPRKLVARIVVKGEENIAAVSMSSDGSLLAVSTISEVKLFHLRAHRHSNIDGLKVQKIECPANLTAHGVKLLQLSPDLKWLLAIRNDNSVYVHRIVRGSDTMSKPEILEKAVELPRLLRNRATPKPRSGTHGDYNRSIIKAAWSSDSRMLVVSDLSGHLDSWVLEGYEDLTLVDDKAIQTAKRIPTSDDDDDDDSDEESHPTIIFGQHWIRNPQAAVLPTLPSFPLVLSFRPTRSPLPSALTNGHTTVHPTRHNPYPHSRDLPNGEDRLLVVTSLHQVYEFEILSGRLSVWSRRNPPGGHPHDFKAVRDRTMDCVWDISGERERVWLYGTSWLWMFDLSKDFPIEQRPSEEDSQPESDSSQLMKANKKRKRYLRRQERKDLMKNSTGAGSKIPDNEVNVGVGNKMRKTIGPEQSEGQWISLETRETRNQEEDDEDYDSGKASGGMSALVRLRRAPTGNTQGGNHDGEDEAINGEPSGKGDVTVGRKANEGPSDWHTYKYRPILGIVTLGQEAVTDDDIATNGGDVYEPGPGVEVALVERPPWDLDFQPRYHGDQEWET